MRCESMLLFFAWAVGIPLISDKSSSRSIDKVFKTSRTNNLVFLNQ